MSRIYHQNINKRPTPDSEIVRNEKSINQDMSEIISTNRVATKIMMFTNNSVISNTKTSPSPRNFVLSSASKSKTDCTKSEEITLNLTNPTQPFLTTTSELVTNKLSSPLSTETTPIPETADLLEFDEMSQEALSQLISRLESVAIRLENQAATAGQQNNGSSNGVQSEEIHQSVLAFDDLLNSHLKSFLATSNEIGGDLKSIGDLVAIAFEFERRFLLESSRCLRPSTDVLQAFFAQFTKKIEDITNLREKNRRSEYFNHLSAISESIGALGWIAISPAPSPFVREMSDSAQFYTNRVLKDWKEKDPRHATWVKQWLQLLNELQAYVKQNHTTGVTWNSSKQSANFDANLSSSANGKQSSGGQAPPPGPPPPPLPDFNALMKEEPKKTDSSPNPNEALFAAINKGCGITSGLKKVTADQQTHKNPNLRAAAYVAADAAPSSKVSDSTKPKVPVSVKPPVFELDDKKWKIENHNKRHDLVVDKTEIKHTVYIYKCNDCTITVKGKINSILVDSCSKVGLLFDDLLSTVEFINCQSVQMQTLGTVPTVCIEKTDGCQVYLSSNSLKTEIVSSKSSAMNVLVPREDGEYDEQPVPEQFKTSIKSGKLATVPTDN